MCQNPFDGLVQTAEIYVPARQLLMTDICLTIHSGNKHMLSAFKVFRVIVLSDLWYAGLWLLQWAPYRNCSKFLRALLFAPRCVFNS